MDKLSIEEAYKLLEEAPRNNKELWIKHIRWKKSVCTGIST